MESKKGGLGRGFDSLFLDNSADALNENSSTTLKISEIEPDKTQPRTEFDEQALAELENSIREYGVLQPILVRPVPNGTYIIVAGERRYRAARRAGLTEVPVVIKTLTESEAAAIALIENLQREDLNAIEEAMGIKRLMDEFGYTQEETAEKLSKSRPAIANSLRLLSLPEEVTSLVKDGFISAGHGRALLGIEDKNKILTAAEKIAAENLSVRQTEQLVKTINKTPTEKQPKVKKRDKFYDEAELAISNTLARQVNIVNSRKGGKLEIEFFDMDDLKKLIKLFNEE